MFRIKLEAFKLVNTFESEATRNSKGRESKENALVLQAKEFLII